MKFEVWRSPGRSAQTKGCFFGEGGGVVTISGYAYKNPPLLKKSRKQGGVLITSARRPKLFTKTRLLSKKIAPAARKCRIYQKSWKTREVYYFMGVYYSKLY